MTLFLGILFVTGTVLLVLGFARAWDERRERERRTKDGPRWW